MSGALRPGEAVSKGRLGVEGDSTAIESLSELFKVNLGVGTGRVKNAIQPPS